MTARSAEEHGEERMLPSLTDQANKASAISYRVGRMAGRKALNFERHRGHFARVALSYIHSATAFLPSYLSQLLIMAGGLVAGYDSDSGSEPETPTAAPAAKAPVANGRSSIMSKLGLPPPSASSISGPSKLGGLMSSLPPPKSSTGAIEGSASSTEKRPAQKRKHQIKIDSLADLDDEDGEETAASSSHPKKAPKTKLTDSADGPSVSSSHSLFGMLPAPSRKGPPSPPAKAGRADDDDAEISGVGHMAVSEDTSASKGQKKGNADFRALLGLKPSTTSAPKSTPAQTIPKATGAAPQQPSVAASQMGEAGSSAQARADPAPAPKAKPANFFSLGDDDEASPHSDVASSSIFSSRISAAPSLAEPSSSSPFPGWQQNPDGSWIPVTPEAQEAFAKYQAEQQAAGTADPSGERSRELERLRAQGVDLDSLQTVDMEAQRAEWEKKPQRIDSTGGSASLDAKYAEAAGLSAAEHGTSKRPDTKATGHRAQRKGQLSSMLAQADERRDQLEEKWAQNRNTQAAARGKYGW